MRVLYYNSPPFAFNNCRTFPMIAPTFECAYPGYAAEIIYMITQYANIPIEPMIVEGDVDWGYYNNVTWTGMFGYLYTGKVDMMCNVVQFTQERSSFFAYSYPLYNLQIFFIIKRTNTNINYYLWDAVTPFNLHVWLAILGCITAHTILASLIQFAEWKSELVEHFNMLEALSHHIRLVFNQTHQKFSIKFVAGKICYLVFGIILVSLFSRLYTAFVLSPLLLQTRSLPFNTFEECVALIRNGEYHVVADEMNYRSFWYFQYLRNSEELHFKMLREAVKDNPVHVVSTIAEALDRVELGNYVYPTQDDQPEILQAQTRCGLLFFSKELPQTRGYFLLSPNSSYLRILDRAIRMNMHFIGHVFHKYLRQDYLITGEHIDCNEAIDREATKPLTLMSTFGFFLIFLGSIGVCVIFFLMECTVFFIQQRLCGKSKSLESTKTRTDFQLDQSSVISIVKYNIC